MGCSCSNINVNVKTKERAIELIKLFSELLEDDLYCSLLELNEDDIKKSDDGFWFYIDEEPLFAVADDYELVNYFVKEVIKRFPNEYLYLEHIISFNNCGDTTYCEYRYDEQNKILNLKVVYAEEGDGLYICPECDEDFEGEPLVYIEDYKEGETYICPFCGAEITFDAEETIEKISLEEILSE